ncbi:MAG: hypothetical protein CL555_03405 [Algoriphagus sp.]|nr:hypothetical protein [Algoriphagus sp.]
MLAIMVETAFDSDQTDIRTNMRQPLSFSFFLLSFIDPAQLSNLEFAFKNLSLEEPKNQETVIYPNKNLKNE